METVALMLNVEKAVNFFLQGVLFGGEVGVKGGVRLQYLKRDILKKIIPFNIKMVIGRKLLFTSETNFVTKQPA